MRVITGLARGKRLRTLSGNDVRPTTEKVKEAVFSSIQFELENSKILDLFAGCGQMGIEALSRGALSAVFCDNSKEALDVVQDNLKICELTDKAKAIRSDYLSFLSSCNEKFDICFLDPPYYAGYYENALNKLSGLIKPDGKVICEHPADIKLEDCYGNLTKQKDYRFSNIIISKYCLKGEENEK